MTTTMINNRESIARRTRTKRRRPKFLSLRLQLTTSSAEEESKCENMAISTVPQLDPENSVDAQDENVDYFFSAAEGGAATTTLSGLLGGVEASSGDEENSRYGGGYGGVESKESNDLVRTAMRRRRERGEEEEEKWVHLAEVVEVEGKLGHQEEVTSCAAGAGSNDGLLSLKLDYQEIINAWADKISPLLDSPPQTVPDILCDDDHSTYTTPPLNGIMGGGWGGGLWSVPDQNSCYGNSSFQTDQRVGDQEGPEVKLGQREASMLRYKEKRQNRLFSKRIRYQVRKLNAENRPRMKGRFVKRN